MGMAAPRPGLHALKQVRQRARPKARRKAARNARRDVRRNAAREPTVPKILIVDDDRTTTTLLVTLFQLEGFEVVTNPRPDTVRAAAREQHPDALLVDCHLADR